MKVLYLCDKRQDGCKTTSCGSDCHHTLDIRHAKNFELGLDGLTMIEKTNPLVIFECKALIPKRVLKQIREELVKQVADGVVLCDAIVKPVAITGFDGVIYDIYIVEQGKKGKRRI